MACWISRADSRAPDPHQRPGLHVARRAPAHRTTSAYAANGLCPRSASSRGTRPKPSAPWSRAIGVVSRPAPSSRSATSVLSRLISTISSKSARAPAPRRSRRVRRGGPRGHHRGRGATHQAMAGQALVQPQSRSRIEQWSARRRTSVVRDIPKSPTWLYSRSSSRRITRRYRARAGRRPPASRPPGVGEDMPMLVSPDTRSASSTPSSSGRPSKSFSVPLWVKYSRDSSMCSPTTPNRNVPLDDAAWTAPTGSRSALPRPAEGGGLSVVAELAWGGVLAERGVVGGPEPVADQRTGIRCPSARIPRGRASPARTATPDSGRSPAKASRAAGGDRGGRVDEPVLPAWANR